MNNLAYSADQDTPIIVMNAGNSEKEQALNWDDVTELCNHTVQAYNTQLLTFEETMGYFKPYIEGNQELVEIIEGATKSFSDVAVNIQNIMIKHADEITDGVVKTLKTGVIDPTNIDDAMLYVNVQNEYVYQQQLLGDLSSTWYIDIFTRLNCDPAIIANLAAIKQNAADTIATFQKAIDGE